MFIYKHIFKFIKFLIKLNLRHKLVKSMEERKLSIIEEAEEKITPLELPNDLITNLNNTDQQIEEKSEINYRTPSKIRIDELGKAERQIMEEKTILYYSDFEINVNDWCTEYENLTIFKMNLKKLLGESWSIYISLHMKALPQPNPHSISMFKKNILDLSIQFFLLINRTLPIFEDFYPNFIDYSKYHNFVITNNTGQLESLMKSFHIAAGEANTKMLKKIENDRLFELKHRNLEFEKAINKFKEGGGSCIRKKSYNEANQEDSGGERLSSKRKAGWRYTSGLLPNFTLIKNRIITPLITTSEKIVDYIKTNTKRDVIYIYI